MSVPFRQDMTLREARAALRDLVDDGYRCPCCTQFAKVYRRKIHATMARELIKCWRTAGYDWFHMPTIVGYRGGDICKCEYWGLIEEEPDVVRDDGGRAGWWRLTSAGASFVLKRSTVPKYARVYDGRLLSLVGVEVSIVDALGDKFDYGELMGQ